ncbi:MAG: 21.5 kDa unknown protein [Tomato vitivirus 1]|nr:MAG: 21.5 kDa unknown protein [Tomato vitivirus 1]
MVDSFLGKTEIDVENNGRFRCTLDHLCDRLVDNRIYYYLFKLDRSSINNKHHQLLKLADLILADYGYLRSEFLLLIERTTSGRTTSPSTSTVPKLSIQEIFFRAAKGTLPLAFTLHQEGKELFAETYRGRYAHFRWDWGLQRSLYHTTNEIENDRIWSTKWSDFGIKEVRKSRDYLRLGC